MRYLILLVVGLLFYSTELSGQCTDPSNNQVDLQSVSIDPETTPIKVGEKTLLGFQVNNNNGGTNSEYIPAGDAVLTISYPANIISVDASTVTIESGEYTEGWTVTKDEPGVIVLENTENFPKGEGSIITIEATGTVVGGSDLNLGLNSNLDAVSSNCGDVNNNQTASGTIYVVAATPLPVTWTSFDARGEGEVSKLSWVTSRELNNAGFYVERSLDGLSYEVLGYVEGRGTRSSESSYVYTDASPRAVNYYRLKQVDHDGSIAYSGVREVRFDESRELSIYPSLTRGEINVSNGCTECELNVYDYLGKLVKHQGLSAGRTSVNMDTLPAGSYRVQIVGRSGQIRLNEKIVKID